MGHTNAYSCEIREPVNEMDMPILLTPGWDFGRPLVILHRNGPFLVLRREGHTTWAHVGAKKYTSTFYMLVKLGKERISNRQATNGKGFVRTFAEELDRVRPGRKWRDALKKLIDDCDSKAKGA